MEFHADSSRMSSSGSSSPSHADSSKNLSLPSGTEGLVIGAGGRTARKIREITGCSVFVHEGFPSTVEIKGPDEASVAKAAWLVEGISALHIRFEGLQMMEQKPAPQSWRKMTVGTPVSRAFYVSVQEEAEADAREKSWSSWCPCCRRPLDIRIEDQDVGDAEPGETLPFSLSMHNQEPRYAYVAALWGDQPGFVLGALVLGHALERTSQAKFRRVLLHTSAVPEEAIAKLQQVWELKKVSYLVACDRLFLGGKEGRFEGTFTKLHALSLTEFSKILVLDLDLVVLESLDHLFELKAPAALGRGANDRAHACRIDGRRFFLGGDNDDDDLGEWCWGQGGGINAGVMLLEPNWTIYQRSLDEVMQQLHPEHIPGSGPEQDYLSRLYAPYWHHISVKYNYQIHHVFYNLESSLEWWGGENDDKSLPARMKLETEEIAVIHFSGTLKMWDRDYQGAEESDEAFAMRLLRNCSEAGCYRWIDRKATDEEYARHNVVLHEKNDGIKKFYMMAGADSSEASAEPLIERGVKRAQSVSLSASVHWRADLESMLATHSELGTLEELLQVLGKASSPEGAQYHVFQNVEFWWEPTSTWYPAVVSRVYSDGTVEVHCVTDGWHGIKLKMYPSNLRERL